MSRKREVEAREALLQEPPHPAKEYFSNKLRELAKAKKVRMTDGSGKVLKLTPARIAELLKDQCPDLEISQTQMYRYYNGTVAPRADLIYELAFLFKVSPREFLPPETED